MKAKPVIIGVIVVAVLGVGGYIALKGSSKQQNDSTTSSGTATAPTTTKSSDSAKQPAPTTASSSGTGTTESFAITANDDSASPDTVTVKQGDTVKLTFNVSSQGTYHGGLDFKSTDPAIDSGSIAEGSSKTISFTAAKSFKFTPYWYQSNVQKDYFVTVNVQ